MHNEDRELQIELTRLQITHEHEMSVYTIGISVILALVISNLSIYVPLGVQTGNTLYRVIPIVYASIGVPVFFYLIMKMRKVETRLEENIRKLKEKYLW